MTKGILIVNDNEYTFEAENYEVWYKGDKPILEISTFDKMEVLQLVLWLEKHFDHLCYNVEKIGNEVPFYTLSMSPDQQSTMGFHKFMIRFAEI